MSDPNQGGWGFAYNGLGEVLAQTDARGITTQLTYDVLGQPKTRTATVDATGDGVADTVNDSWNYDPANAKGAPASDARTINGALERSTTQTYDALARPIQGSIVQALTSGTQTYGTRTATTRTTDARWARNIPTANRCRCCTPATATRSPRRSR